MSFETGCWAIVVCLIVAALISALVVYLHRRMRSPAHASRLPREGETWITPRGRRYKIRHVSGYGVVQVSRCKNGRLEPPVRLTIDGWFLFVRDNLLSRAGGR